MNIAILGRTKILYETALLLSAAGHQIVLVGTCKESPEYGVTASDFQELAKKLNADFFNDTRINHPDIVAQLRKCNADIAVSLNWLTVIGQESISAFPLGILNGHAGELPRYRGNACPNWAILQNEAHVAFTVHQMAPGELDAGPIVIQDSIKLSPTTTIGDIYTSMEKMFPHLFRKAVDGLASGLLTPQQQPSNSSLALRCYPRLSCDGHIDWSQAADMISRLVRASSEPFNGAYTYWDGKKVTIWRAYPATFACPSLAVPGQVVWRTTASGEVGIATGNGVLVLQEIQIDGRRSQASELLRSLRIRLGTMVEDELALLRKRLDRLEKLAGVYDEKLNDA